MGGRDPAITATVRDARCKDCVRERQFGWDDPEAPVEEAQEHFEYNEAWAQQSLERGGSRTDRCPRHRRLHKQEISGLAVAYIDLQTIGEVSDRTSPMGPLGGLGPLPDLHEPREKLATTPFSKFGMTDEQVRKIYVKMSNPDKRVLVLKAGTGTGKSTFFPFRLLCPPDGVDFSFTARGPIVVTEPRVQATVGVARYVGERLVMGCPLMECNVHGSFNPKSHIDDAKFPLGPTCADPDNCGREHVGSHPAEKSEDCCVTDCARHIGPGYPVGYQVKGDARHDAATQLVYVTDGTMLNWLREGRLNKIGTVVVDEAHERSTNIDFIMGYLCRELDRYPHLRVVITSATFDVPFYENYFGGPDRVETMTIDAKKTFGYGSPLFPITDGIIECGCERNEHGELPHELTGDFKTWRKLPGHWPESERYGPEPDDGSPPEDLWAITEQLHNLRFTKPLPDDQWTLEISAQAKEQLGQDLADHVIALVAALVERKIYGDILGFLPNNKLITDAVALIEAGIDLDRADVYALIQSAPPEQKEAALEARPRGSKRKIVISTNLAETSLTVSGVRFVVDCALTTQGAWNPTLASKSVPTTLHSQAGVRQRWGRVGRDAPGWVFPLYTRSQFNELPRNTPPGSTRDNLEQLVMKAKSAGIDDVAGFPWPAAHEFGELDTSAQAAMDVFKREIVRADAALVTNGVVDPDGHLTAFGRELERFGQHSAGFAVATIIADQLACVPEVVTALALLEAQKPQGYEDVDLSRLRLFDRSWPEEWRDLAAYRWQQLHIGCQDDLDVALRIVSLWERADPERRPWEQSPPREAWARSWWLRHDVLLKLAELRRTDLEGLSAAMKEEVKRLLEPRLTPRARAAITRAFVGMRYRWGAGNTYASVDHPGDPPADLSNICRLDTPPPDTIALTRGTNMVSGRPEVRNLVAAVPWAANSDLETMDLLLLCAEHCHPRDLGPADYDTSLQTILDYPIGSHIELDFADGEPSQATVHPPFGAPIAEPEKDEADADGPDEPESESKISRAGSVGWPAGFVEPIEDEERNERLRLEEPDDDERDETTERPLGVETNDEDILPTARTVDVLAHGGVDGAVDLRVGNAAVQDPGWYRCDKYAASPDGLAVVLEPLSADQVQVTDPAKNPAYSLFEKNMIVMGVVDTLTDRALRVRFCDRVTGFSMRDRLPRLDYTPGETVVARVHAVDPDKKLLILDLAAGGGYEIKATAPEHWRAALRFRASDLNERLSARAWASGLDLTLSAPDAEAAADTAERLRALLGSPAAAVDVPGDKRGRVQGARAANLIAARTESGAVVCDFEDGGQTLLVSAETQEQLRACLDAVLEPVRGFTGRLIVPSGRTGLLIGKGGATINEFKRESGCYQASAGPDGNFTLAASSPDHLNRFAQLANWKVPGCALVDVGSHGLPVRDLFGDSQPVAWQTHNFARGDETVDIAIAAPSVVDMRPGGTSEPREDLAVEHDIDG
jgi:HrpA-like RNA helicase